MWLNLPRMILRTQGICTHMHMKIDMRLQNIIFNTDFQLICGVEYYATTCLDHVIEKYLTVPYYRNSLEKN
jgi:hypothetical protein